MGTKTPEYFRALPYHRRLRLERDASGAEYFVAFIDELDGVEADGADPAEARLNLQSAFEDYVEAMLQWERTIPEPEVWPGPGYIPEDPPVAVAQSPRWRSRSLRIEWEEVDVRAGSAVDEDRHNPVFA